jgi:plastocyanin
MVRVATVLLAVVSSLAAHAATLAVEVRDPRGAPVEDAVVYAISNGRESAPPKRTAVMDQKNRTFIPHVLAVQTGTAVRFPNSDDIRHQVYSFSPAKTFQLPLYTGTPATPVVFDVPGVVTLGCNIHDRMNAYIVVVDTPYFATTEAGGAIELGGLPAGTYTVHLWYPGIREATSARQVTLGASERETLSFIAAKRR